MGLLASSAQCPLPRWWAGQRGSEEIPCKIIYMEKFPTTMRVILPTGPPAYILELSKMTVCTRVDGTGPGDAFAGLELLTGLVTAHTDDLVRGLVSGLVRSSGSQF